MQKDRFVQTHDSSSVLFPSKGHTLHQNLQRSAFTTIYWLSVYTPQEALSAEQPCISIHGALLTENVDKMTFSSLAIGALGHPWHNPPTHMYTVWTQTHRHELTGAHTHLHHAQKHTGRHLGICSNTQSNTHTLTHRLSSHSTHNTHSLQHVPFNLIAGCRGMWQENNYKVSEGEKKDREEGNKKNK